MDTRFSYCALACLSLLGARDAADVPAAARFVARCQNWDGGFGVGAQGPRRLCGPVCGRRRGIVIWIDGGLPVSSISGAWGRIAPRGP